LESENTNDDLFRVTEQRRRWDSSAVGLEKWRPVLQAGSQIVTDKMIKLAGIKQGDYVLDLATGTGDPAIDVARIVQTKGHVVAVDFSQQRLEIARKRAKEQGVDKIITFDETDIENIDLSTSKFDAILSRWGLMFFSNLNYLLVRIHNALLPDSGVFVAAIWSTPEKVPFMKIPLSVLDRLGLPPLSSAVDPFRLSDVSDLSKMLFKAGFQEASIEGVSVVFQFDSADKFIDFAYETSSSLRSRIAATYPEIEDQVEIRKAILEEAKTYSDSKNRLHLVNETLLVTGRR
jgi:ubiquinone/menaquinone biosynthesis C-methylase UbiE